MLQFLFCCPDDNEFRFFIPNTFKNRIHNMLVPSTETSTTCKFPVLSHYTKCIVDKLGCARVKLHFWLTILEMVTILLLVVVHPGEGV